MAVDSTTLALTHDVESRILKSLKKRHGIATAGDVAADTGLGYDQTDWALQKMLNLYKSHLDVDDDGNLRYRFNPELTRRGEVPRRTWRQIKHLAWTGFMAFFKVWTMLMLVGYTIAFIVLLLALSVLAIGASIAAEEGDIGEIGFIPFMLIGRLLEFMFWWEIFDLDRPSRRRRRRGSQRKGFLGKRHKPKKAFYQKIFDYLFGPQQKFGDPLGPEKAFAQFARSRRGRLTASDWASRTGQSLAAANNALTASLVRFSGDVDVTDDGALIYRFDSLRVSATEDATNNSLPPIWLRKISIPAFTGNKFSSNAWITAFNAFNLIMAGGVIFVLKGLPIGVAIGLGWVPLVFSALFFWVPLIRRFTYSRRKARAETEAQRRQSFRVVFESADQSGTANPVAEQSIPARFQKSFLLDYEGDIAVSDAGQSLYTFPTLAMELEAGRVARASAANEVVFGKTIFSSDEQEKSLDDAAMDDFERRLALELGGDVFETHTEAPVHAEIGR